MEPLMSEVINNSYTQKNYFPIDGRENVTESLDQLDEFEEFSNLIAEDPHFISEGSFEDVQKVIAFLVEAVKQLYKDDWKKELMEIKNKIIAIRSSTANPDLSYKETTWFLNKIFLDLYEKAIALNSLKASKENDFSEEKFYLCLFKNIKNLEILGNNEVKNHCATALGGVHDKFVPTWLKESKGKYNRTTST